MISCVIWFKQGVINFSKTTNYTRPTGLWNFVVFEKGTHAYLLQIALEIMLFRILNWPL